MSNKRIISLLLAVLFLFASLPVLSLPSAADETPISLTGGSVSGMHGETVIVPINVQNVTKINGFQFRVTYDPAYLEVVESSVTINRPGNYSIVNFGEGFIELMWTNLTSNKKNTPITMISFVLLKTGSSQVTPVIDADQGDGFYYIDDDNNMVDVPVTTAAGTVTALPNPDYDFCYVLSAEETPYNRTAQVDIAMRNAENVYGFSLEVTFDPAKLAFVEGAFSELFPYGRAVCLESGRVRVFAATTLETPANGDVEMASILFEVIDPDKAAGSTYDLGIEFYNNEPSYSLVNGKIVKNTEVGTRGVTLTLTEHEHDYGDPVFTWTGFTASAKRVCAICQTEEALEVVMSDEVTTQPTTQAPGVRTYTATVVVDGVTFTDQKTEEIPPVLPLTYDINGDGVESIEDVTALLNALSGIEGVISEGVNVDLDGSGTLDIGDVTALLNYLSA